MASQIAVFSSGAEDGPVAEIVSPNAVRALFRIPKYVQGDYAHNTPIMFWLIDAVRPSSFVSLGLKDGTLYFGACQALETLGTTVTSNGIDPDLLNSSFDVVREYNRGNYRDFSHLLPYDIISTARRFSSKSVDILSIEISTLAADPDAANNVMREWSHTFSDRSIILLNGLASHDGDLTISETVNDIIGTNPTIRFDHGPGMTVVLRGAKQPDSLFKLAALNVGDPGHSEVRHVFSRLGDLNYSEWSSRHALENLQRSQESLARARADQEAIDTDRATLREQLDELSHAYDDRMTKTAVLQSQHFDLYATLTEKLQALADREKELVASTLAVESLQQRVDGERFETSKALSERDQELAAAREEIEGLKTSVGTIRAEHLTQLNEREQELAAARQEVDGLKTSIDTTRAEYLTQLNDREQELAAAHEEIEALKTSVDTIRAEHLTQRSEREQELAAARQEVEGLKTSIDTTRAEYLTQLNDREQELAAAHEEIEALKAVADATRNEYITRLTCREQELAASGEEVAALKAHLEGERAAVAELKLEGARLNKQMEMRFQELAILTQSLEERDLSRSALTLEHEASIAARMSAEARLQDVENVAQAGREREAALSEENNRLAQNLAHVEDTNLDLQARVAQLSARLERVEGHYRKIRNTTSWKITAPVRNLSKSLRAAGQRGPQ